MTWGRKKKNIAHLGQIDNDHDLDHLHSSSPAVVRGAGSGWLDNTGSTRQYGLPGTVDRARSGDDLSEVWKRARPWYQTVGGRGSTF